MKTSDYFFSGKHVLITGGIGFIGSALARRLVAIGAHVVLVDSLIPEYGGNLYNIRDIRDKLDINISDVRDPHSMRYLVREADLLFNLAGQTSHLDSMQDPFTDLAINSSAQLYILEACRHYNPSIKIVFASTRQIYGRPTYLPVDEQHPLQPTDVNGINKLAGEQYHILYHRIYGIRSCALRMTNTYGPGMRIKDARQTFVGIWIRCILENEPFAVWGGINCAISIMSTMRWTLSCGPPTTTGPTAAFSIWAAMKSSASSTWQAVWSRWRVGANTGSGNFQRSVRKSISETTMRISIPFAKN